METLQTTRHCACASGFYMILFALGRCKVPKHCLPSCRHSEMAAAALSTRLGFKARRRALERTVVGTGEHVPDSAKGWGQLSEEVAVQRGSRTQQQATDALWALGRAVSEDTGRT